MAGIYLPKDDENGASAPVGISLPKEDVPQQNDGWFSGAFNAAGNDITAGLQHLSAALLEDEGSYRSRYQMKRAEQASAESAKAHKDLSTGQNLLAGALTYVPAIAATASTPLTGPAGAYTGAALFAAQATNEALAKQAQESGRYNLDSAALAGLGTAAVNEATAGLLGPGAGLLGSIAKRGAEGATQASSQTAFTNLAAGKDWYDDVGEAALFGGIAGGAVGGVGNAASSIASRVRKPRTMEDIEPPQPDTFVPPSQRADSDVTGATQQGAPDGMNQTQQTADTGAPDTASAFAKSVKSPLKAVHGLYERLFGEGLESKITPKATKMLSEADLSAEKLGMKQSSDFTRSVKETESSLDILQQRLESIDPTTPEYQKTLSAYDNLSKNFGSFAARSRSNLLADKSGMLTLSKFHDVELGKGMYNSDSSSVNMARDVNGIPAHEIDSELKAYYNSKASDTIGFNRLAPGQRANKMTYESAFNEMHRGYTSAAQRVESAFSYNRKLALDTKNSLNRQIQPEAYERASVLEDDLKTYSEMSNSIKQGRELNKDKLSILSKRITDNATQLGLSSKLKNLVGEEGTFNPILDMEGWKGFHDSVMITDPAVPAGRLKQEVSTNKTLTGVDATIGTVGAITGGAPLAAAAVATKKIGQSLLSEYKGYRNRIDLSLSQRRGKAMASQNLVPTRRITPTSEEEVARALAAGDIDSAVMHSEDSLKKAGINTGENIETRPKESVQVPPVEGTASVGTQPQVSPEEVVRSSYGHTAADVGDALIERARRQSEAKAKETSEPFDPSKAVKEQWTKIRENESQGERAKRLTEMARKTFVKQEQDVKRLPPKERSKGQLANAEAMKNGFEIVKKKVSDYSKRNGYDEGDVWADLMRHKEGINHVFSEGFKEKAIEGRIRTTLADARNKARRVAEGHVTRAGEIINKSLRQHDVARTVSEAHDQLIASLKKNGVPQDIIDEATKRASDVTPSYTARQVANHAASILEERAKQVKEPVGRDKTVSPSVVTHALKEYAENLKLPDGIQKSEINGIIKRAIKDSNKGLSEAQEEVVVAKIKDYLSKEIEALKKASEAAKDRKKADRLLTKAKTLEKASIKEADSALKESQVNRENSKRAKELEESKKANEADKRANKLIEQAESIRSIGKEMDASQAKGIKEAKAALRDELEGMNPTELEEAGRLAAEKLPYDVQSINDPAFQSWKMMVDVASEGLKDKGKKNQARILETLSNVLETGLKRKEQLPGKEYKDLILTEEEYQSIAAALGETADEGGKDVMKAATAYFGNLGQKVRSILLGSSKTSMRQQFHLTKSELNRQREAALNKGSDDGLQMGGIKR